ncbi:MAG TPA: di-heme oxidoredictase family protein [Polyangiaceae bacterium]|nr:di-heme oxidoredictase family protein [Polyangiaceae bacterium]
MHRTSSSGSVSFSSLLCLAAVFAAGAGALLGCTGNIPGGGTNPAPDPNSNTGATGGSGNPTVPTGGTGTVVPPDPSQLPVNSCTGVAVPATFVNTCSGCHTLSGTANANFPDLYNYAGTLDEFKAQVRNGGKFMAAYPATLISDADLEATYSFFTGTTRGTAVTPSLGSVVPLFSPTDAVNPPVVTVRPDGVIVTRGAGRVRGRHEKEGTFASFEPNYFEDRTYGFIIEDFTPLGQDLIRTTYLPLNMPDHDGNRITNWRSWKVRGDNATFVFNNYLPDATMADVPAEVGAFTNFAFVQQYDETQAPEGRSFSVGENYEFEIGVFIDPSTMTTEGSRTSYYTDCFRYRIGEGGLTPNNQDYEPAPGPIPEALGGGDTTIAWILDEQDIHESMGQMALNIQPENVQNFAEGRRMFHTDFVTGEHSELGNNPFEEHMNQAGPLFATTACTNCHLHNGPGTTVTTFSESTSMAFKLYNAGDLGDQLQLQEGTAALETTETKQVTLGDGTVVTLTKPLISVTANSGTIGGYSARVARKLVGLGLLEALEEETILSHADPLDCDKNGISGRPNYITDPETGAIRIGRMGWKAEKVSVRHQVADALNLDIGVTTSLFMNADTTPEISEDELLKMTTYMRLVGVYPQRNAEDPAVVEGGKLFRTVGCNNCHVTDAVTGPNHPFAELRNQSFKPYSDLLLHDMGPDLADNSNIELSDAQNAPAAASEWRTSPLSSIGFLTTVGAHTNLLHDGRAASVLEAVLWHGGEASSIIENFKALPAADREALIAFVQSL